MRLSQTLHRIIVGPSGEMSRKTIPLKMARIAFALSAFLLATAAVACGGTSSGDKTSTAVAKGAASATAASTKASSSPAGGSSSPTSGGTQKQLTITAKDFSFSADDINVSKGDTIAITFKNAGAAAHTLTFFSDDAYKSAIAGDDTGSVTGGTTKTLKVTADVGLYYRCNIHPSQMQGEIGFK